jgi:hypothetical protein
VVERGAALVERHDPRAPRNHRFDARALGGVQGVEGLGAAGLGLDRLELNFQLGREALGVIIPGCLRPIGHALPDGHDQQLHGA